MSKFINPESKTAILYSLGLPLNYIIFDGEKYWMIHALGENCWRDRKPYYGHVAGLRVAAAYTQMLIPDFDAALKPGYGTPDQANDLWEKVRVAA